MKHNPVRYSSQVGEVWAHFMYKVKYCHPIFDNFGYRNAAIALFRKALIKYEIRCKNDEIGFDSNHLHMELDLGLKSRPQIAKELKGYVARKFFKLFPELKRSKNECGLFWNSGLWSPATFGNSSNKNTLNYIRRQKYGSLNLNSNQTSLRCYV